MKKERRRETNSINSKKKANHVHPIAYTMRRMIFIDRYIGR